MSKATVVEACGQERRQEVSAGLYTYESMWSEEDRAFVARVAEFPALEAHGDSRGGSLRALMSVVDAVVKDLAESGAEIPPPSGAEEGGKR